MGHHVQFTRFFAIGVAFVSLSLTGCPGDTAAGDTEGATGTGSDTNSGSASSPITTTSPTAGANDTGTPTSTDPTLDGTGGDDAGAGNCCVTHAEPGCENATCADAVCEMNASCCAFEWSSDCVDLADRLCEGCTGGADTGAAEDDGTDDGGSTDQCCAATPGVPGCPNEPLEDCVCMIASECCSSEWNASCADLGTDQCGASCPVMEGDCCQAGRAAGCLDDGCEGEVCAVDPFCCRGTWDGVCADAAAGICEICGAGEGECCSANGMQGCIDDACVFTICDNGGEAIDATCCTDAWDQACADAAGVWCVACGGGPGTGDCCEAHRTPGCVDDTCNDAVCAVDSFCCTSDWDEVCAAEAAGICTLCGAGDGDCCTANGMQGCNDDPCVVALCGVDEVDDTCCTDAWDQACADQAANLCVACGAVLPSDCCESHMGVGCDDDTCETAICDADPYCCDTAWDQLCAAEAQGFCATCGGGMGDCCEANGSQGCNDAACVYEICSNGGMPVDQTCCTDEWTQACADAAPDAGCACP